jgi:hypothetical protein
MEVKAMDMTTQLSTVMPTLFGIAVVLTPFAVIVGLLRLADRVTERRDARYARQIELTDAIHRELGAIVAPTVHRRRGGGWLISMAVPFDPPGTIATVLRITDERFGADARSGRAPYEVVLTLPAPGTQPITDRSNARTVEPPARLAA